MNNNKKSILALVMAFTLNSCASSDTTQKPLKPSDVVPDAKALYKELELMDILPEKAFVDGYKIAMTSSFSNHTLAVVDFTRHSSTKRLNLFDLDQKKHLMSTYVSHGMMSGTGYATSFSNELGSNMSSLGHYVGNETYSGKNGYSLRVDGMTIGANDNARRRYITFHKSSYANPEVIEVNKMLGRSNGCFAVPEDDYQFVINQLKEGGIIYAYHDGIMR
ncbi:murein L,D-transpeptidase catalytic domain family protein [Vibrio crassostreae]|uniref:murein L,D-transpeptidase catalytic domain family protein n=1 Tax=Vibrio crassostreae TaxID=246167 RepID=UPI001B30E6AF|nr:murein L,D-transpeptidase catalytic domain family protein [Vibrio crassostreae]